MMNIIEQADSMNDISKKKKLFSIFKIDGFSSKYKGLHSEESLSSSSIVNTSNESLLSTHLSSQKLKEDELKLNPGEVPYTFIWDEGGNDVKVTGGFVHWKEFKTMTYYPEEKIFKIKIGLPKTKHEYKFIVDGAWKYNTKQPITKDNHNNINNIVDLTNYIYID